MDNVNVIFQVKQGRNFVTTWRSDNAEEVYKRLSNVLVSKKLCGCTWVKSIKRIQRYTHVDEVFKTIDAARALYNHIVDNYHDTPPVKRKLRKYINSLHRLEKGVA